MRRTVDRIPGPCHRLLATEAVPYQVEHQPSEPRAVADVQHVAEAQSVDRGVIPFEEERAGTRHLSGPDGAESKEVEAERHAGGHVPARCETCMGGTAARGGSGPHHAIQSSLHVRYQWHAPQTWEAVGSVKRRERERNEAQAGLVHTAGHAVEQ